MVKLESVRAREDGNYQITYYNEEENYKFNFTASPESCCPPFFTPEDPRIITKNNVSDCKNKKSKNFWRRIFKKK